MAAVVGIGSGTANGQSPARDAPRLIEILPQPPQEQFRLCMTLASESPTAALIEAEQWEIDGGGNLARECAATALANSDEFAAAAQRFEVLAREIATLDPTYAADLYREAGRLWMRDGFAQRAVWVLEAVEELVGLDPQLLIQRARARQASDDDWGALEDLYQASEIAPNRPDLLSLRANLLQRLQMHSLAVEDLTRALEVGGDVAELTLERGIVRLRQGDQAAARLDFQTVLEHAPESISAEIARREIERLDSAS